MLREALGMEYNTDKNLTNTSKLGRGRRYRHGSHRERNLSM